LKEVLIVKKLNARSSFYVGKWRALNWVFFVLMMSLAVPLLAQPPSRIDSALEAIGNWLGKISVTKFVPGFLAAKGTIRVALLEGDEQVIKPKKSIYFGFLGGNNSYEVKLTGNNCSQIISSSKQEDSFHSVVFNKCQFVNGHYSVKVGSSIENKFRIKKEGCPESKNRELTQETAYHLAYENSMECVFEAYQIVAKSNEKFAKVLALGIVPQEPLP